MSEPQDYELLATGLADMARELLELETVQETLDSICANAVKLVDGCEAAGIMVVSGGKVQTVAATDNVVRVSDRAQGQLDGGPCFDAASGGERSYRIEDMGVVHERWPSYAEYARGLGVGSMMGFLLYTNGRNNLGALDMYSTRAHAFSARSQHVGWVMASHAAVALSSARNAESMDHALATSRLIGEAIGVVMARYRVTDVDAFDMIRQVSQNTNVKVRDLAETITSTGELPGRP